MAMEDCNHKYNPMDKIPVGNNMDNDACVEEWEYCSVVGMILYLSGCTFPDIAFVVHQYARFSHNSK